LLHVATALRSGEAFGLRWQDIDWQKGQISIRRGWSKGKETRGKTKRSMTEVAMHPVLAHALDKLGIRLESDDMPKRFLASRRTGFYLSVAREGEVAAGDEITLLSREQDSVSISEILRLFIAKDLAVNDVLLVRRALTQNALPDSWKQYFHEKVSRSALA
jgi:integrase